MKGYWTLRVPKPGRRMQVAFAVLAFIVAASWVTFKWYPAQINDAKTRGARSGRIDAEMAERKGLQRIAKDLHAGKIPCEGKHGWHYCGSRRDEKKNRDGSRYYCCRCGATVTQWDGYTGDPLQCHINSTKREAHGGFYPVDP